eukprot:13955911-Alexandrium_andersonii.AAC.1
MLFSGPAVAYCRKYRLCHGAGFDVHEMLAAELALGPPPTVRMLQTPAPLVGVNEPEGSRQKEGGLHILHADMDRAIDAVSHELVGLLRRGDTTGFYSKWSHVVEHVLCKHVVPEGVDVRKYRGHGHVAIRMGSNLCRHVSVRDGGGDDRVLQLSRKHSDVATQK